MTVSYSPGSLTALGDTASNTACIILMMIIFHITLRHGIHFACQACSTTSQVCSLRGNWRCVEAGTTCEEVGSPNFISLTAPKNLSAESVSW